MRNEAVVRNMRSYPEISLEGLRKTIKISIRIVGIVVKIWKQHLPNKSPKHYRLNKPAQCNTAQLLLRNTHLLNSSKNFLSCIEPEDPLQSSQNPHTPCIHFILFHFSNPTYSYLIISSVENAHVNKARDIRVICIYKKRMNYTAEGGTVEFFLLPPNIPTYGRPYS